MKLLPLCRSRMGVFIECITWWLSNPISRLWSPIAHSMKKNTLESNKSELDPKLSFELDCDRFWASYRSFNHKQKKLFWMSKSSLNHKIIKILEYFRQCTIFLINYSNKIKKQLECLEFNSMTWIRVGPWFVDFLEWHDNLFLYHDVIHYNIYRIWSFHDL
jgi:hypothetical protein